jgi:hypothetical protein
VELDAYPSFTEWLQAQRAHFHRRAIALHHELVELHLSLGAGADAIRVAGQALRLDPTIEETHCLLMQAHAACGRPGAAIEQFHRCLTILQEELGTRPSAETRACYARIAAGTQGAEQAPPVTRQLALTVPGRRDMAVLCVRTRAGGVATEEADLRVNRLIDATLDPGAGHVIPSRVGVAFVCFGGLDSQQDPRAQALAYAHALRAVVAKEGDLDIRYGIAKGTAVSTSDRVAPDASGVLMARAFRLADGEDATSFRDGVDWRAGAKLPPGVPMIALRSGVVVSAEEAGDRAADRDLTFQTLLPAERPKVRSNVATASLTRLQSLSLIAAADLDQQMPALRVRAGLPVPVGVPPAHRLGELATASS